MSFRLGMDAKLYYKVLGVADAGAWVLAGNVRNVKLNLDESEADVTTRENAGWRATAPTLRNASVDFEIIADETEAGYIAFRKAFFRTNSLAKNFIGIAVMNDLVATVGSEGLTADCAVSSFQRSEDLEDAQKVAITLKPTYSSTDPAWLIVA